MEGLFFNTGAVESWSKLVNCSGNLKIAAGALSFSIMKMTKKHEKWLIYKLKGFFVFSRYDVMVVRDDVCRVGR